MNDKLRELAEQLRTTSFLSAQHAADECGKWSDELLAILDAEGDAGAAGGSSLSWEDAKLIARKAIYASGRGMIGAERRFLEDRVARAVLSTLAELTHPQPVRSGVVSDAQFNAWRDSLPAKHWAKYDLSACKLGWEAAIKSQGESNV